MSTNELDAVQGSGNLLKIAITNHLGRSELFSVSSDFSQKWTYVPGADVILNNEKKIFEIYFTPDKPGTFSGNVFVTQKDRIIKTVPVSLFVSPKKEGEIKESLPFISGLGAARIAALAGIFALALLAIHFGLKKPKALEPKMAPPQKDISEVLKAMSEPIESQKRKERQDVFFVPRNKIII